MKSQFEILCEELYDKAIHDKKFNKNLSDTAKNIIATQLIDYAKYIGPRLPPFDVFGESTERRINQYIREILDWHTPATK